MILVAVPVCLVEQFLLASYLISLVGGDLGIALNTQTRGDGTGLGIDFDVDFSHLNSAKTW